LLQLNQFYIGEAVNFMKENIPDNFVDLIITSPPYDDLRKYNGFIFDYQNMFKELYRVTKDGGVVVWVVGDKTDKGSETLSSFKHALYAKKIGFNVHDTMIWEKTGMLPTQDRYYNIFEYMFVLSKGKPKTMNFICDHKTVNGGKIQKKDNCINKGKHEYGDGSFIRNEYSRRTNIWRIHVGKNKETKKHPAPFPEQLAQDHIITWSNEGDIVLDPMCGSGTTCKMAYLNKRNFISIDMSEEYINDICIPRLNTYGWEQNQKLVIKECL